MSAFSLFRRAFSTVRPFAAAPQQPPGRVPSLGNVPPSYKGHYFDGTPQPEEPISNSSDATEDASSLVTSPKGSGLIKNFLFGSEESRREIESLEKSYSSQLMRGKYVHEITYHHVLPESSPEYVKLMYVMPFLLLRVSQNANPSLDRRSILLSLLIQTIK